MKMIIGIAQVLSVSTQDILTIGMVWILMGLMVLIHCVGGDDYDD